jgi:hypothetical protein
MSQTLPSFEGIPFGPVVITSFHITCFRQSLVNILHGNSDHLTAVRIAREIRSLCDSLADWLEPVMGCSTKLWTLQLEAEVAAALQFVWVDGHAVGSPSRDSLEPLLRSLMNRDRELQAAILVLQRRLDRQNTTPSPGCYPAEPPNTARLVEAEGESYPAEPPNTARLVEAEGESAAPSPHTSSTLAQALDSQSCVAYRRGPRYQGRSDRSVLREGCDGLLPTADDTRHNENSLFA